MNEVWGRCAEEVSLDLTGSFWTNLLPRVKNEATIKVFASQASEESDWETTAYGLSKRLVSRSRFSEPVAIQVRIRKRKLFECGNSSVGRAIPCQGIGRRFEPVFPLQVFRACSNTGLHQKVKAF